MLLLKYNIVAAIVILSIFTCSTGKNSNNANLIQKVDSGKAFKKLLRTKTNVLVMFSKNEAAAKSKFDVFGEAAKKSKGTGTLCYVDCSEKEGKKLCKKYKAESGDLMHFKDGEFSSKYERKFSATSIFAFLKDPKADGPWQEEDSAKDVVHLATEKQLMNILKKNKPTLVMFYAPWCGYCKRFKPVFAEVATEFKKKAILAGYDAETNSDAAVVREKFNITGFPKTLFFSKGSFQFEYGAGLAKSDLSGFLDDPQPPKPKEPEVEWSAGDNDVSHLEETDYEQFVANNNKVLLFFYAPWCGHCKNLKPEWEKAATALKEDEAEEKLAAMDAQKFPNVAKKFKVSGYPTVIYFENGEQKFDATSGFKRTAEGIVEYIKNPSEPPPPEKAWHETESDVVHLDDSNFQTSTRKKKHSLVMFYAPWCGHCKKAKPEFQNAAALFSQDKKISLAAVDCTTSRTTCDGYDVKGFPTFYYLSYGKKEEKYTSGRTEKDFVAFLERKGGVKTEL